MYSNKQYSEGLIDIHKHADQFSKDYNLYSIDLDFSINSLNIVESFIDENLDRLSYDFVLKDNLISYITETLLINFSNEGKIEFQKDNKPVFVFYDSNEKLNIENFVNSRLILKQDSVSEYVF